ncbi:cation:proton antiporter domain-containing protein [Nucisporomicrobium flavum]|uniref:cation:proton antiporter domain-containing protein n=1 Tax=Nucisporomicrobium flavum TaxID=2785915 RepID=UPI0018F61808|nr:cation:proton antiporter [Nucisporomicrobium flavum]
MDIPHTDIQVAVVMADIAVVLGISALLVPVFRRLGQPPVIGEIVAGILLGPSVLGLLPGNLPGTLFPASARPFLSMIAQVGLLLFMFLVGWEFNFGLMRRAGRAVTSISLTAIAFSFGLGLALATWLYRRHHTVDGTRVSFLVFAVFLGAAMSITAFPVLARILSDGNLTNTRVGSIVLASAAIDDVVAWTMLAVVVAGFTAAGGATLAVVLGLFLLYVLVMAFVVRPLLHRAVRALTRNGKASVHLLPLIGAGLFLSAFATSWIGVHVIFGAFAFGIIMPRENAGLLGRILHEPLENCIRLLLPIFFIVTGLSVDLGALGWAEAGELALIILCACSGKLLGAGAAARVSGQSWRDSYSIGLLMNTRGLTELVILNIGVTLGLLDGRMFTMMVIMALVTTAMAGPLLPRSLPRAARIGLTTSAPAGGEPVRAQVLASTTSRQVLE